MDRQTLRDWVHRFNAAGLAGLVNKPHGGGAKPRLTAAQKAEVARWVEQGPDIAADGIMRWRCANLARKIAGTFAINLHERSVGRLLHSLAFSRVSVRPRHPKADAAAQETRKKTSPIWWPASLHPPRAASRSSCVGKSVARRLWAQTGLGPGDIDVVQPYENFAHQGVPRSSTTGFARPSPRPR